MAQLTPNEVSFYPSQEYFDKNWAGQRVPLESLRALARSQAIAEQRGIIDSETAKYYLPSALTENRWADYGVNNVNVNYGTAPPSAVKDQLNKADEYEKQVQHLKDVVFQEKDQQKSSALADRFFPTRSALLNEIEKLKEPGYDDRVWAGNKNYDAVSEVADRLGLRKRAGQEIEKGAKYDRYLPVFDVRGNDTLDNPNDYHTNAAIKTLALFNKIQESGKTGLDAWERYNGSGPQARDYRRKVNEAYDLMNHPKNRDMWNAYNNMVKQYKLELNNGKR